MASDNKYDRQLRLWGQHGQNILNESRILLIGASGSGSETLKNLILPRIKHFTIVDSAMISKRDLGQNFFLTHDMLGQPRAKVMYENLIELNPEEVTGSWLTELDPAADWKDHYDLVLATDVDNNEALEYSERCHNAGIPFVLIRQYGLIGTIKLDVDELCVAEQKLYMTEQQDMRLNAPFEELLAFVNEKKQFDLPNLQIEDHAHVPYVVLLLQGAAKWREEHDGNMPKNFAEKKEFGEFLKKMALDYSQEINFTEACKNAFKLFQAVQLPDNVQDIFEDKKLADPNEKGQFWLCAAALKKFHDSYKTLPVAGSIPDMTSHTKYYLGLQRVYQARAQGDLDKFKACLQQVLTERGVTEADWMTKNEGEVVTFCKNANFLEVTKGKSFRDNLANYEAPEEFAWELHDPETTHLWYLGTRVIEEFRAEKGYNAGLLTEDDSSFLSAEAKQRAVEEFEWLKEKLNGYVSKSTPDQAADDRYVKELLRFADSKIHTVSAFLGGIASQEIIKILIKQYTTFNSTLIYDGIHGRCQVYK